MKKVNKKIAFIIIAVILVIALAVFIILGIVNKNKEEGKKETTSESKVFQDYNVGDGLLSVDDKNSNLSERQKIVLQYFDDNYLSIEDYSYFKRYPDIFKQTKVSFEAAVEKVLKSNDKEFEVLAQVMSGASASQSYVIIKGDQTERRLMEGECIKVQGRFINNEDMTIDGVSYNLPVIEYHNNIFCNVYDAYGQLMPEACGCTDVAMYDEEFAKEVAEAIFGDSVSVRMGTEDDLILVRKILTRSTNIEYQSQPYGIFHRVFARVVVPRKLETSASFIFLILNYFYKHELVNIKENLYS